VPAAHPPPSKAKEDPERPWKARWRLREDVARQMLPPVAGGAESPRERVERLLAEGKMPRASVQRAERLWREQLRSGVSMPNGELVWITLDDLYHVIVDDRIWRHPERIKAALTHVFEIRASHSSRRQAFSRWSEGETTQLAALVLTADSRLWSIHLIDEKRLRRYNRQGGELLWRQSEQA